MRFFRFLMIAAAVLLAAASPARAQGVQTGIITGVVQSADGLSLPGVTVTVASPALQGQRVGVTDVNGVYSLKGLPAGTYYVYMQASNAGSAPIYYSNSAAPPTITIAAGMRYEA